MESELYYVELTGDEKGTVTNSFENYTVEIDSSGAYNAIYDMFKNGDGFDFGPVDGFGTDPTGVFTWKIDSIHIRHKFLNFGDLDVPAKYTVDNIKCDTDYELNVEVTEDGFGQSESKTEILVSPSGFSSYEEFKENTKQLLSENLDMSWEEVLVLFQQYWGILGDSLPYSEENFFIIFASLAIGDYCDMQFKINTENYVGFSISGNVNITLGNLG